MSVVLHPRGAGSRRLRVWVGAFNRTTAPALRWLLDGTEAVPTTLRDMSSAREVPAMASAQQPRAFTGLYELGAAPLKGLQAARGMAPWR
jgi:hypothetical protein